MELGGCLGMIIHAQDVSFEYGSREAVRDVTLSLRKGETVSIVGPNGAGKTTLIKCLASIYSVSQGAIYLNGKAVGGYTPKELAREVGYVAQSSGTAFPFTVLELVLLGRNPHVRWGVKDKDLEVVEAILADLRLLPMADRHVDELSGGERQKVFLARALAQEPQALLLDEPISALDIRHQLEVLGKVRELARRDGTLVIMILHDLELAARYSDRVILMRDGSVYAAGEPGEVLTERHIAEVYGVEVQVEPGVRGLKITALAPI